MSALGEPLLADEPAGGGGVGFGGSPDGGELEPIKDEGPCNFAVIKQSVELEVNFRDKRVDGRCQIIVASFDDALDEVAVDARQMDVDVDNITVETMKLGPEGYGPAEPPRKVTATYRDPYRLLDQPECYGWTAEHHDLRKIRMRPLAHVRDNDLPADARDALGCTPVDGSIRVKIRPPPPAPPSEPVAVKEEASAPTPTPGVPRRPTLIIRGPSALGHAALHAPVPAAGGSGAGGGGHGGGGGDDERRVRGQYRITIPFSNRRIRDGLQFVGVDEGDRRYPHLYTRHSIEPGTAACIFPCIDDHGSRCDWKLSIKCPRTLGDALRQPLATQQQQPNGHATTANGVHGRNAGSQQAQPQQEQQQQQPRQGTSSSRDFALTEEDKMLEMTVICSGLLTDEIVDPDDDHKKVMTFEPEHKVSVQKLGFAVGPFEHVDLWSEFRLEEDDEKLGASALKVHGYCLPGRADEVRNACAAVALAADFFALTFSSYPFDSFKLCFVDDMVSDTTPLYSLAFVSSRLLFPEDVIDTEIDVTRRIVHSLACQWSGISVVPNTRRDVWITVGVAYFMTDLFMKKLCGNNDYRFRMKTMSDRLVQVDVDRPPLHELGRHLHVGDFEVDFMALKAPVVLFILDKRLIKASGSAGLIRILSRWFGKCRTSDRESDSFAGTESFRKMCEKNGKHKLEHFWAQWVYGSGCPQFDVTQRFNKKRLCVEMTIKQVQIQHDRNHHQHLHPHQGRHGGGHGHGGAPDDVGGDGSAAGELKKSDFLRLVKELHYGVKGGPVQALFTGPMTIRIHEADGTPYEHIVEIREDNTKGAKFDIPYNTKYKRLKRNRRQRERQNAANAGVDGENQDDVLLYCLGDVLQTQEEVTDWGLFDWPPDIEKQMDQESYEWIRIDSDFEWACSLKTNLKNYMYVSQLQQDRDVVAQQDSLLFLAQQGARSPHPLGSTFLVRTLMDRRYFHGIRTLAAEILPLNAAEVTDMIGMTHLHKAFQELFCYPGTNAPRPNDFSDKRQYQVQCALPAAIARVRDRRGRCPRTARRFILDQLLFNNNASNPYSDHFYVARLLEALATSLIPERRRDGGGAGGAGGAGASADDTASSSMTMTSDAADDGDKAAEERQFLREALDEIDRYRRMDEWTNSYRNVWTVTALDCKRRLMKAGVVPVDALDFVQYLQDETLDEVRIKAFEALVDLGLLMEPVVFRLLLCCLSTDRSPFVRDRLTKVFARGLAALAFGEAPPHDPHHPPGQRATATATTTTAAATVTAAAAALVDVKNEDYYDDDGDLMVVEAEKLVEARKYQIERRSNFATALAALKTEVHDAHRDQEPALQDALWAAVDSDAIGRAEKLTLIELCGVMFEDANSWLVTLKYPKRWKATAGRVIGAHRDRKLFVTFKAYHRTQLDGMDRPLADAAPLAAAVPAILPPAPPPPVVPAPRPALEQPQQAKRMMVSFKASGSKPARPAPPATAPAAVVSSHRPSIAVAVPEQPAGDSIVAASPAIAAVAVAARPPERKPSIALTPGTAKAPKRPRPDKSTPDVDGASPPVQKKPKLETRHSHTSIGRGVSAASPDRPSRIVTFSIPGLRLAQITGAQARGGGGGTINARPSISSQRDSASPAALGAIEVQPAGSSKPARKPLPSSAPPHEANSSPPDTPAAPRPPSQPVAAAATVTVATVAAARPSSENGQAGTPTPAPPPPRPKIVIKRPSQMG